MIKAAFTRRSSFLHGLKAFTTIDLDATATVIVDDPRGMTPHYLVEFVATGLFGIVPPRLSCASAPWRFVDESTRRALCPGCA